jgi:dUTP pyrophosphatase
VRLAIKRIDPELPVPAYAHVGDAGLDLRSAIDITIAPGARALIPTGIAVAVPEGCAGFVLPRSGLAIRHGLGVLNSPGLIDSAYRGEIKAILVNHDPESPIVIARGDKIVQLVIQRVENCQIDVVAELDETVRGEGGFGSTGV